MEQNIVLTTELQEKFKSAWGQRQVILFTAPCGCGKSAAASVLLEPHTVCRWIICSRSKAQTGSSPCVKLFGSTRKSILFFSAGGRFPAG